MNKLAFALELLAEINAAAEAEILRTHIVSGAHCRAIEAKIVELKAQLYEKTRAHEVYNDWTGRGKGA
jgi:hypothetical protein